jgi:glycerol-3-phosphate acyltransferase PlsY
VSTWIASCIALVPFYLLGCFPTGYLIARLNGIDITHQGSGNVGATNVARVIGKKAGVCTLLGDVCKGMLAVALGLLISPVGWFAAGAAAAVVCGHCFSLPPWLRGGKGVATALGTLVVLYPVGALVAVVTFGLLFWLSRTVSIASLIATAAVPTTALLTDQPEAKSVALVIMSIVIAVRHKENIIRVIEGREPKFSANKDG